MVLTNGNARRVIQSLQAFLKNPQYQDVQLINKMKEKQIAQQPSMLFGIVLTTTVLTIVGIATLGLMNHTASSIRQRSREFAAMRAVGTTRPQMMRLILAVSLPLS
ncbi:MAG: FtsX-like permease family protein [Bacilli bacterium]